MSAMPSCQGADCNAPQTWPGETATHLLQHAGTSVLKLLADRREKPSEDSQTVSDMLGSTDPATPVLYLLAKGWEDTTVLLTAIKRFSHSHSESAG